MNAAELISDPIFQLNLLIFLSWPHPPSGTITPILIQGGYKLLRIEMTMDIPPELQLRFQSANIAVQNKAKPDILLENESVKYLLSIECKKNSFGPDSKPARQARAILAFGSQHLIQHIGKPTDDNWQSIVSYMSSEGTGALLLSTLQELSNELNEHGILSAPTASLEISGRDDGVYLALMPQSALLPNLDIGVPTRVMELVPGEDPRTLYLIPYIPGGTHEDDSFHKDVFRERLRAAIVSLFGSFGREVIEHDLDKVITSAIQVWQWWDEGQKRGIRDHTRAFLKSLSRDLRIATGYTFLVQGRTITMPPAERKTVLAVQRYMRNTGFRQRALPLSGFLQDEINFP